MKLKSQVRRFLQQQASSQIIGSGLDAGTHESLAHFYYIKYLMDFLIFLQGFFPGQGREGKYQVLYCNSRFDFVEQQMHGGPVRQGQYVLI
jgi:hypothetical protein